MKLNDNLLKFPRYLPNDLENFLVFYPMKFPPIVPYYENVARKIAADPDEYKKYGDWAREEVFAGFEKIQKEYNSGDKNDLSFLIDIDMKFHKLICYRFWIVNYLFADGPLHDFFVDSLKSSIRKMIDVAENVEDFEDRVVRIQRDLLQSDYADLYLQQALSGRELLNLLLENKKTANLVKKAIKLIDERSQDNTKSIHNVWDKVIKVIEDKNDSKSKVLREKMKIPFEQSTMRGSKMPIYYMLTHSVEFRQDNEKLVQRYKEMGGKINEYLRLGKKKLNKKEFELFKISYLQARNFSMYKDLLGEVDPILLPLWFSLHKRMLKIMSKNHNFTKKPIGPATVFYFMVWYLPMELKDRVMTPDPIPYSLQNL